METASLRIKFTPLLKKRLQNESKCSLEIVPEVTCVQNLDKISWKQEDDLIEYTVPMTYKIILKRREIVKNDYDDLVVLEKTYHSCVDLLPPSSMTAIDFASGDITRNISDTYVMGKIFDADKNEIDNDFIEAIKAHVTSQQKDYPKEIITLINENNTAVIVEDDNERYNKHDNVITNTSNMSDSVVIDKHSLDKITNTENNMILTKVMETQSVETITEISTKSRDDSKRKLSLSPICSIDTNDSPFPESFENKVPFNSVVQYEIIDFIGDVANKHPNKNKLQGAYKIVQSNTSVPSMLYRTYKRELPQARVAKFLKKMETEIMPLKIMLNDILIKCSRLGLNQTKFVARNLVLYKTLPGRKNQVEKYCKTEKQTKSNRVVYSIVFEGAMDNDSIVEQIVRSLSFEVEAVPQDNIVQVTTSSKSTPLNVKIRVRKKEGAGFQHGVLSLPKPRQVDTFPERIRLVSSDQTIMSFNVVMEADFDKPVKKPRKNILGIFKPTICLGAQPDEDDYAYMPKSTDEAESNGESTSKSDGTLTKLTLSKNVDDAVTSSALPKRNKDIFGKCKPGGCLDPPFDEEKYPYTPQTKGEKSSNVKTATKTRTSSIFSNGIFSNKRKLDNEQLETNVIKKEKKTESAVDLFQAGSLQTSATYSNSIITYPPTLNSSELPKQEKRQLDSKTFNTISKNSLSVQSGSHFVPPKKQKKSLDNENTVKLKGEEEIRDITNVAIITVKSLPKDENDGIPRTEKPNPKNDHKKNYVVGLKTKESTTDIRDSKEFPLKSQNYFADQTELRDKIGQKDNWETMSKNPEDKLDISLLQEKINHDVEFILTPSTNKKFSKTSQKNVTDAMTKDSSDPKLSLEQPHDLKNDKICIGKPKVTEYSSEGKEVRDQKSCEKNITEALNQNETKNMIDNLPLLESNGTSLRSPERQILKNTKKNDFEDKIVKTETVDKNPMEQNKLYSSNVNDSKLINNNQPAALKQLTANSGDLSKPNELTINNETNNLISDEHITIPESPNINVLTEKQQNKMNSTNPMEHSQMVRTSENDLKLGNDKQAAAVKPHLKDDSANLLKTNKVEINNDTNNLNIDDYNQTGKPPKNNQLSEKQHHKTEGKDPMEQKEWFSISVNDSTSDNINQAAAVEPHFKDDPGDLLKPNKVVTNNKTNDDHNITAEPPKINLLSETQHNKTKGKDPMEQNQSFGTSVNDSKLVSDNEAAAVKPHFEDESDDLLKPNKVITNNKTSDFIIDDHNLTADPSKMYPLSETQQEKTKSKDSMEHNQPFGTSINDSKSVTDNKAAAVKPHFEDDSDDLFKPNKVVINNKTSDLISDYHNRTGEPPKSNLLSETQHDKTKIKDPMEQNQLFGTPVNNSKLDNFNQAVAVIPHLEDDSGDLIKPNKVVINEKTNDLIIDDHSMNESSDTNLWSEKHRDKTKSKYPLELNKLFDTNVNDSKLNKNNKIAAAKTHIEADSDDFSKLQKLEKNNESNDVISDNHNIPVNESILEPNEVETILPSAVTLDARLEQATFDLAAAYDENIKTNKETAKYPHNEGTTTNIPTPIERDTPLRMSFMENDYLEHIWENERQPLESDTRFHDVKVLKNQIDQYHRNINTLTEGNDTENINGTSLSKIPPTELIQTDLKETNDQNYFQSENERKLSQNGLPLNPIIQNIRTESNTLNRADSKSKINNDLLSQSNRKNREANQNVFDRPTTKNKESREISLFKNNQKNNDHRKANLETGVNEHDLKEAKHNKIISNAQQFQVNKDRKIPEVKTTDRINIWKNIKLDTHLNRANNETTSPILSEQAKKSQFDSALRSTDSKRIITPNEVTGIDKIAIHEKNKSRQVPATDLKNSPIFKLNVGLQSYVDHNNEVIVKSFDLDKTPKRYPNDSIKVTTSYLKTDDEIKFLINSKNYVCIQIKSKEPMDITGVNERKLHDNKDAVETRKTGDASTNKKDDESIQRNIIIADDIKKTLVAVYEDELLPLRNTIAELKDNMEMLTTHHMRLKGHMLVKKTRSSKVIPLYRKCGCMRR